MGTGKRLLLWSIVGSFIGATVAMIAGPAFLMWYETPGDPGAMCNCVITVRSTCSHFIRFQLTGALAGAMLFLIIGLVLRSRAGNPPAKAPSASSPQ